MVDTIACNKLRANKFSPVMDVVNNTSGYQVADKAEVYPGLYSPKERMKINKKIMASKKKRVWLLQIYPNWMQILRKGWNDESGKPRQKNKKKY